LRKRKDDKKREIERGKEKEGQARGEIGAGVKAT